MASFLVATFSGVLWYLGKAQWATFNALHAPMVPSTSLTFILLSTAVFVRSLWPDRPFAQTLGRICLVGILLISLQSLLGMAGIESGFEKWLAGDVRNISGYAGGKMATITAVVFLMTACALWLQWPQLSHRPISNQRNAHIASHVLNGMVFLVSLGILLGYAAGTPFLYGAVAFSMAALTAIAFMLTSAGLFVSGQRGNLLPNLPPALAADAEIARQEKTFKTYLMAAFLMLSAAIIVAGVVFLNRLQAENRAEIHGDLKAIAELKAEQIVRWRKDRIGDAQQLMRYPSIREDLAAFIAQPDDPAAREKMARWLSQLILHDFDAISILDVQGKVLLTLGYEPAPVDPWLREQMTAALHGSEPYLSDLHRTFGESHVHQELLLPVRLPAAKDPAGVPSKTPALVMLDLHLNPEKFLFPLIRRWPTPSQTAETFLARQEGDHVLFLTNLRHLPDTALKLTLPLNTPGLPSAGALQGQDNIMDGIDYRGVPVLAATLHIPDTPWVMVAKIDQSEAYAPLRNLTLQIGGFVMMLLLCTLLFIAVLWRQRSLAFYRRMLAHENEKGALSEHLADLAEFNERILVNSFIGILVYRDTGECIKANQAAADILGATVEQLLRQNFNRIPSWKQFGLLQSAQLILKDGGIERRHLRFTTTFGKTVWIKSAMSMFICHDSKHLLLLIDDVAERKQKEQELIAAQEAAQQANLAKSHFLSTMSHEIRTPMNGILGMAQLLLHPEIEHAEARDYARTILHSGQALLAQLNDILDLAKVESGKMELESIALDPELILHETHLLFAKTAENKGLTLEAHWHGPAGQSYLGDPHRLRQILANLTNNAIKFTSQGHIRIDACETQRDDTTAVLELTVADTGIGIPEDKLQHLFQPFSQVDSSITRKYGGSGLGLSIVRNLARLMDGDISVTSQCGEGALFRVNISVGLMAPDEERRLRERGRDDEPPPVESFAPMTGHVLVAEDDPVNRTVVKAMLRTLGLGMTVVEDGRQCSDAVMQGDTPDLVLMDIQMPIMDGYVATERIRQWEKDNGRPRLPIIALTADAYESDKRHCAAAGMDGVLAKPVALHDLGVLLGRWLRTDTDTGPPKPAENSPVIVLPAATLPPVDVRKITALLAEIEPMLMQNRFDAIDLCKKLEQLVAGTPAAAGVAQACQLVREFRFDQAREHLRLIAAAHGWGDGTS